MKQIWWRKPVTVETTKIGQKLAISTVERAATFLLDEWSPDTRGHAFVMAKSALLDALWGKLSPDEARTAFIKALRKSDIYIFDE